MRAAKSVVVDVDNLNVIFGQTRVVQGLSFSVKAGEILAIVGESGCGKSMTALALMGLLSAPGRVEASSLRMNDVALVDLDAEALRQIRGNRMSMIFQEPMTSLNPVLTIGEQIVEAILAHRSMSDAQARQEALRLLERVKIPSASTKIYEYPHRLSGGMRQRVMIAIALANAPDVLIADEPTTALDVTVQAEILDLIDELRRETGMAVILISHDFDVVTRHADNVLVMYAGKAIEFGAANAILNAPRHPYTRALIEARPKLGHSPSGKRQRLRVIPGTVPSLQNLPKGCAFAPRCGRARPDCLDSQPPFFAILGHKYACFHPEPSPYAHLLIAR